MLKEVKVSELAKMIDLLDVGQAIEFSSGNGESDNWECWYFAKKMCIQEYASDFLLIDYCGGGQAQAYSIYNNQAEQLDTEECLRAYAEQLAIEECLRAYMYTINDTSCDHFGQVGGEFVVYMDEEEE